MIPIEILTELEFKTSRSGGAGGQNVNKVETRVQLLFNVNTSSFLTDEQKIILNEKLSNQISKDGILSLSSDTSRSQLANKNHVSKRFIELIEHTLKPKKPRKKTEIPDTVKISRLENKRIQSERKANRKTPNY